MTTAPQTAPAERRRLAGLVVPEMWASLAIVAIWLAVLFTAVFGPDIESQAVNSSTRVPSAVAVALFGSLATWAVARHGFRRRGDS